MEAVYQPIPCILHDRLEFSVLRRISLRLAYKLADRDIIETVMPLDVATRNGAEWLEFRREDGSQEVIRLDWIISFEEIPHS